MIPVVIDTNVVISATQKADGFPASILALAANKRILMCVSAEVLDEYEEVLRRPRFRFSEERIEKAMALIRATSLIVYPTRKLNLAVDEDDNIFYECADAAQADFLITGNTKHFPGGHAGTQIITPREFIGHMNAVLLEGNLERTISDIGNIDRKI